MIELRSDPYVLKSRTVQDTELDFRINLNLSWCRGVLFNVVAQKNSVAIVEYDAILWTDEALMFVEYKDSVAAYKNLSTRRIQQIGAFAKNIAAGLGYRSYTFVVVVNDLSAPTTRGGAVVIPLYMLGSYEPVFSSAVSELEMIDKLIEKYAKSGNDGVAGDLSKLKTLIETGLS
ncbi:MAG: hypothetical protein METHAR1v1_30009 [Methanothrix sp.]|jgi:hypothetical protein|nr:MAG: hypothetical protein METHAR1v1_30009 [Methanothrix sp.]